MLGRGAAAAVGGLGTRFALTYIALAAVFFSIYGFPFELFGAHTDWLAPYLAAYARLAGSCLRLVDPSVVVSGTRIDGRFSLQIVRNCDAIEINILFACAVLAFPAPLVRKLIVLSLGLAALVCANVLRICVLYFIGASAPSWFRVAHEELLPLVLVAAATCFFLAGARYLARAAPLPKQA